MVWRGVDKIGEIQNAKNMLENHVRNPNISI